MSGTNENLNLIVLNADERKRVFKSEILKVFPEGMKHLPDELQPREIYPMTRSGTRKVQYIGKAERFGFNARAISPSLNLTADTPQRRRF